MAASLQQRLEAEQRFTADVAHELRTPLTGLHTAAELLPPGRPTELVRDRVAALRTLTEDLLEVARLDANREEPQWEAHPLGPLVESITRRSGVAAEVVGGRTPARVRTDVRRLERILANLLANARRHGGDPVTVTVSGTTVTVRDNGPGFPERLLREGPQRFLTGAPERGQGTGLGLTIALGQAQVIGARVTLANPAPGVPRPRWRSAGLTWGRRNHPDGADRPDGRRSGLDLHKRCAGRAGRPDLTGHQQARGQWAGFPRKHDPVSPGESPCADVPHTCSPRAR